MSVCDSVIIRKVFLIFAVLLAFIFYDLLWLHSLENELLIKHIYALNILHISNIYEPTLILFMNPSFYFVPENKSGEMGRLPIPGDYRAECFPLAKSRLTLAPLIHILLISILLLTSSTLLARLRLGLLLILSSNSIFISFRVDFFHLVYASRVQRTVGKRLNTRYQKIRKDPEVTWEEGTLDP